MGNRAICVALAFLLLPAGAWADRHKAGLRFGSATALRSSLWGIGFGGEWELPSQDHDICITEHPTDDGTKCPEPKWTWSIVSDVSFVAGFHQLEGEAIEVRLEQLTYMAGARATYGHGRVQPFLQGMAGGTHQSKGEVRNAPAGMLGAGADLVLGPMSSKDSRGNDVLKHPRTAIRGQVDGYWLGLQPADKYVQFSLSFVVRFNRPIKPKPSPCPCPPGKEVEP